MAYYLKLYFATLLIFFAIDMLWLGLVARTFYQKYLGFLMTPSPNWFAAIVFYLLFIVGILVFVVGPGLKDNSLSTTLGRAALFGLITYACPLDARQAFCHILNRARKRNADVAFHSNLLAGHSYDERLLQQELRQLH